MSTGDLHRRTLTELAQGLASGDFSSVELVQGLLDRIERFDGELNAFVTLTADRALEAAEQADARRQKGDSGVLDGLPIVHMLQKAHSMLT